jgi:hypothetical protein
MMAFAVLQVCVSFFSGALALLVGGILVSFMIWRARVGYLPSLMICCLTAGNFNLLGHDGSATAVNLVQYPMAAAVFARVAWEWARNPECLQRYRIVLWGWGVVCVLAVAISLSAKFAGNPSWSNAARGAWLCGAFFWGVIMCKNDDVTPAALRKWLLPTIVVLLGLFATGVCSNKLKFILLPVAIPLAWVCWRNGSRRDKILAVLAVNFAAMLGFGIGFGSGGSQLEFGIQDEGTNYGVGGSTLSMNGLLLLSVVLTVAFEFVRGRRGRRALGLSCGLLAFMFVVAFSFAVAALGPKYRVTEFQAKERIGFVERLRVKLFDDRSNIWTAALADITRGNMFFKVGGQTLWIDDVVKGEVEWEFSAHNAIMNTFLVYRWLGGALLVGLLGVAMTRSARVVATRRFDDIAALGILVLATGTIGIVVNDYPMNEEGAFWFFGIAGVVVSAGSSAAVRGLRRSADAH